MNSFVDNPQHLKVYSYSLIIVDIYYSELDSLFFHLGESLSNKHGMFRGAYGYLTLKWLRNTKETSDHPRSGLYESAI